MYLADKRSLSAPSGLPDPDAELMLRVGCGDAASFAILLDKHRPSIVRFLFHKVRNLALAEELSQDVFLRVYRSRQAYRATARFRTWIFRIASNLALNAIRDSRKEDWHRCAADGRVGRSPLQIADGRPSAEQRLVHQVKFGEVRQAIAELPDLQRSAVLMQRYEEMDYAAIASALNCSESAVKSLIFRAHESLRHRLAYMIPAPASNYLERLAS